MTTQRRRLGAVLYENFELLDLYGPLEMFGCLPGEIEIVMVAERAGPVRSTPGPETLARHTFDDCPHLDLILLPGGVGTIPELQNEAMLDFLRTRAPLSEVTMSVCTGSALLARAGLLDGRRATTNKVYFDLARAQGEKVEWIEAARWVEDGPYVTSSGVSAGTDMALAVIARLFGIEHARTICVLTEFEWHEDSTNDPFHAYLNRTDVLGKLAPGASS